MKNPTPIAIIAIILILGAVTLAWTFARNNFINTPEENSNEVLTYANMTYGYAVNYPADLQVREYTSDNVVFGKIDGEMVNAYTEIRIIKLENTVNKSFQEKVVDKLKELCTADSPESSFSCTSAETITPIKTISGLDGYAIYLDGELKNKIRNEISKVRKGPYYVFDIKTSTNDSSVVVIHTPLNQTAEQAHESIITSIAQSIRIDLREEVDTNIEMYISQNISELSPIKEELGGSFFVTDVQAKDGKGVVEYEDGHNPYVATFTYEINSSGDIVITSFEIKDTKQ